MVGLVDDSRFQHQHPCEYKAAQRAAQAANEARETAQLEQQQQRVMKIRSTEQLSSTSFTSAKRASSPPPSSRPLKTRLKLPPSSDPKPVPSPQRELNNLGADIPRPPNSRHDAAGWPVCLPGMKRPRYTPEDLQSRCATPRQIESFYHQHPALGKRNFFIVQEHHATSKHWDVRLQLDGGTVSWVVPRGLFSARREVSILGVETDAHPISYTLHEGFGVGTTKLEDVGFYEILPTFSEQKRQKKARDRGRRTGLVAEDTSDEEAEAQPDDEKQEDLFAQGYYHALFQATPSRWGAAPGSTPDSPFDDEEHRGFVVKLTGKRYKNLTLRFHRRWQDAKMIKPRDDPKATFANVLRRMWFITLDKRDKALKDDTARELLESTISTSILTGRTMAEIKAARDEEKEFRTMANWQRKEGRWVLGAGRARG
ncbi:hypothetical protein BCR35DRAFT_305216 [Leucosporidium creatinivorum]|uniref:DNA ligase D 3'-phosphoesterase domain-containing protein n=1 Tax=Leucosporidium creatinivorum TaxID=106004 RepID=A0A1Y2F2I4_9BASI|nr:hypothetical protein BCR35DRAFT_305216 [Leucosporidium creatinivorum]